MVEENHSILFYFLLRQAKPMWIILPMLSELDNEVNKSKKKKLDYLIK